MTRSARELDRQATRLVRRAIVHHSMDKGYRCLSWPREELLEDGYGPLVIRKAKYLDAFALARGGWVMLAFLPDLVTHLDHDKGSKPEMFFFMLVVIIWLIAIFYRLRETHVNHLATVEDQRVIDELSARLGPETILEAFYADEYGSFTNWRNPQPQKPLLWRVDRFLSGKSAKGA